MHIQAEFYAANDRVTRPTIRDVCARIDRTGVTILTRVPPSPPQLPVLQTNNGPPLVGLATIACHLTVEAKRPELLGDSAESRAVVQQWLEHRVTRLDGCRKDEVKSLLKVALCRLIAHAARATASLQFGGGQVFCPVGPQWVQKFDRLGGPPHMRKIYRGMFRKIS